MSINMFEASSSFKSFSIIFLTRWLRERRVSPSLPIINLESGVSIMHQSIPFSSENSHLEILQSVRLNISSITVLILSCCIRLNWLYMACLVRDLRTYHSWAIVNILLVIQYNATAAEIL